MTDLTNIVEILAKQALGGGQQQSGQAGGLGGILGSVLGQLGGQQQNTQNQQGGLGGILGSVLGQLGGTSGSTQSNATGGGSTAQTLLIAVLPLVLAWIQKQGGLQGALDKLKNAGLSNQVQSWVDPQQQNAEDVPAQNIQSLFDDQDVEQVAQQTQAPKQAIYGAIASVLPQVIDSLTPQGSNTNPQEANQDIQQVLNLVSGFLKK
ncbi:YidB family protein [Acinetobacter sp. 1000160]|uniref:YidB family protein n=1 Tax=Acinetobacter sp. 1000160 TaxID=1310800 RepID=UPI00044DA872|nr:YidB family protein [Acinetobacter sp. 1000160]EXB47607.1 metal-sensitive transcriptional repressor family protein [Acinetobacter baumannii 146457]EYT23531.1 metal-sensitive transcriptional repressor family protein [Acinetobacter sp. 1000160]